MNENIKKNINKILEEVENIKKDGLIEGASADAEFNYSVVEIIKANLRDKIE